MRFAYLARAAGDRPPSPPPRGPDPEKALAAADRLAAEVKRHIDAHDAPDELATALFEFLRARAGDGG